LGASTNWRAQQTVCTSGKKIDNAASKRPQN